MVDDQRHEPLTVPAHSALPAKSRFLIAIITVMNVREVGRPVRVWILWWRTTIGTPDLGGAIVIRTIRDPVHGDVDNLAG
jgi:hypothetical protein